MSKGSANRNEDHDIAYEAIKTNMDVNIPYKWEFVAKNYLSLDIPTTEDHKEQVFYVALRNRILKAINQRAAYNRENWRLFIAEKGSTIIKREKADMVTGEIVNRMSRVASAMTLINENLKPMLGAEGINGKDRRIIEGMRDLSLGASMSIRGGIFSMQGITRNQKLMLTAKLPGGNGDVE